MNKEQFKMMVEEDMKHGILPFTVVYRHECFKVSFAGIGGTSLAEPEFRIEVEHVLTGETFQMVVASFGEGANSFQLGSLQYVVAKAFITGLGDWFCQKQLMR